VPMKKLILLLLILILSGCSMIRNAVGPFEPTFTVPKSDYLGSGITFNKIRPAYYMQETELYQVGSESELALLAAKKMETGQLKVSYRATSVLSLQKTFMYLESIINVPFTLSMGYTEYSRFGSSVDKVYFAEIQHDPTKDAELNTDIDKFLAPLVLDKKDGAYQLEQIHDKLVRETQYDTSIQKLNLEQYRGSPSFEAYGVFTYKKAVCSGYARALMGLAKKRDIPLLYIASLSMEHAWNLVYDGKNWLYIDATWDDPVPNVKNRVLHTYFLLTSKQFLRDGKHRFDKQSNDTLNEAEYLAFAKYVFPNATD